MGFERLHRAPSLPRGGAVVEPSSSMLNGFFGRLGVERGV
jgi:hypothetical protein